jgi:hypothetical protein
VLRWAGGVMRAVWARVVLLGAAVALLLAFHLFLRLRGAETFRRSDVDQPLFASADSYYHAHRVRLLHRAFPRLVYHDRFMFHPQGATAEWPMGFAYPLAAVLKTLGPWPRAVWALPYVTPTLSVVAWALFLWLAASVMGWPLGALATLCLSAALPFLQQSSIGVLDHHVNEVTAVVLLLCLPLLLAASAPRACGPLAGLALGALLWSSTLLALPIAAFLAIWLVAQRGGYEPRPARLWTFAGAFAVSAGAAALVEAAHRNAYFSPVTLSFAHVGACLAPLLGMALPTRVRPRALLIGLALLALAAVPLLYRSNAFRWMAGFLLGGGDAVLANVSEARSLIVTRDGLGFEFIHAFFGLLYLAFPVVFLMLRRRDGGKLGPAILWFSLLLFLLSFSQKKLAHLFTPAYVLTVVSLVSSWSVRARVPAAAAAAVLLLEPLAANWAPPGMSPSTRQGVEVAAVLRTHQLDDHLGVAAPPNMGSVINYVAGLPTVTNAFFYRRYLEFDLQLRSFEDDGALLDFLRKHRIGALVATDDVRYRTMLLHLVGRDDLAARSSRLDHQPCAPAQLRFALDRLACQEATQPAGLQRIRTFDFGGAPSDLLRRAVVYRVR